MSLPHQFNPDQCPLCAKTNDCLLCAPIAYKGQCWCSHEDIPAELLERVPEVYRNRACVCRSCLEKFRLEKSLSTPRSPQAVRRAKGMS